MTAQYVTTVHPNGTIETLWIDPDEVIEVGPIRKITTQAFYRRMTPPERNAIRTNQNDPVQDLREDLQRSLFVDLDGTIEQQLLDTGGFTQTRITDELLIDGTEAEIETG